MGVYVREEFRLWVSRHQSHPSREQYRGMWQLHRLEAQNIAHLVSESFSEIWPAVVVGSSVRTFSHCSKLVSQASPSLQGDLSIQ